MAIDKVTYWIGIADYDLETADAMFITKRWLYVAFMCHQAIEKTLKAYWCATLPEDPPYTHSHKRLADGCGLYSRMSKDQKDFINTVTNYNIEATSLPPDDRRNQTVDTMDKRRTLSRDEALNLVRHYKQVIRHRFKSEPRVLMFGSYSKGYATPDSDIDVAIIVPTYGDQKLEISKNLWSDVDKVSLLIEPVLMAEDRWSPLYDDVMRTGIAV